jgi:hypothetical protein
MAARKGIIVLAPDVGSPIMAGCRWPHKAEGGRMRR